MSQRLAALALLTLFVLFFYWRWDGWEKNYFADELIPQVMVRHMESHHTLDTNWNHADWRGDYASGAYHLPQYNFSSYHVVLRGLHGAFTGLGLTLPDVVFYRACSVVFQWLAMLLVMHALWREAGCWPALAAGGFLAVMPQAVIDAHYARPESFVTLLVAACLWCGWRTCRLATQRGHGLDAVAAVIWGLAVACKVSLLPMALVAAGCVYWRGVRGWALPRWCVCFVVGFAIGAPMAVLDPAGFGAGVNALLHQYATAVPTTVAGVLPSAGVQFAYLISFFSLPVLVWLVLPVLQPLPAPQKAMVYWVWLVTVGYVLLFAAQQVFFERNLSHLLPLWAVLYGLTLAGSIGGQASRWRGAAVLLSLLLLVLPARLSHAVVQTVFRGSSVVPALLSAHEQQLLHRYPGKVVVFNPLQDPDLPDQLGKGVLLRVMQVKLPVQWQLNMRLQSAGWVGVSHLSLPLGELPYNQLQINHAPPGVDYYIKLDDVRGKRK